MTETLKPQSAELKPELEPQKAVRSLLVSMANADEIYENFLSNNSLEKIPILRFYLGKKGRDGDPKRYTFFGGKVSDFENINEAIQREIQEEIGAIPLGIPYHTVIGEWIYQHEKSGPRKAMLTYIPSFPLTHSLIADEKISGVSVLTLRELTDLIKNGELNGIPIEGHLAIKNDKDPIEINDEEREKRDKALNRTLSWMEHIETHLRKEFEEVFKRCQSPEEFKREYERILSRYMRRGLEVGLRQKRDFSSAQLTERQGPKREQEQPTIEQLGQLLKEVLNNHFLGRDILYYLPEIAQRGVNWSGLSEATEGTRIFVDFLNSIFNEFFESNEAKSMSLTKEIFINGIASSKILLEEKTNWLKMLNSFFRERVRESFNVENFDIDEAFIYIQYFFRDLSNEMKLWAGKSKGLYQDFVLTNEVNNANLGYLLSLFLGYDTKEDNEYKKLISFEAGRQLVLLLKGLMGINEYHKKVNQIKNGIIQLAINNFFGPLCGEELINIGNQVMRIRKRNYNGREVIVDEKPTKTFSSFLRKSFEEPVEEIKDFYSVSLVLNYDQQDFSLEVYSNIVEDFVSHLKQQFNLSDKVISVGYLKTYGSQDFIEGTRPEIDGKRKGSQAERIVRGKVIISIKNDQGEENLELTIYPFSSLIDDERGFWGWKEKIADDKYYVARRLTTGENGTPSLYDLLFPSSLYPHNYLHRAK